MNDITDIYKLYSFIHKHTKRMSFTLTYKDHIIIKDTDNNSPLSDELLKLNYLNSLHTPLQYFGTLNLLDFLKNIEEFDSSGFILYNYDLEPALYNSVYEDINIIYSTNNIDNLYVYELKNIIPEYFY